MVDRLRAQMNRVVIRIKKASLSGLAFFNSFRLLWKGYQEFFFRLRISFFVTSRSRHQATLSLIK